MDSHIPAGRIHTEEREELLRMFSYKISAGNFSTQHAAQDNTALSSGQYTTTFYWRNIEIKDFETI